MKSKRMISLLAVMLFTATFALAENETPAAPAPPLVKVEASKVCMVNEQFMDKEQIAVEVDGKVYFGCCNMCKERLATDESKRFAVDPVTGRKVDKAKAVIGAAGDGSVAYFESDATFEKYNKTAKKK
jgi:YHS domain-containing protein